MSRASLKEVRAGLIVIGALIAFLALVSLAGGGPGFLAPRRTIDVVFRDGQGIRPGSPVRVAGIEAGRVSTVDLVEVEGILRARVRLSLPEELAARLRQDAKITIESGLTGQSSINIVSSGRSKVALVAGQTVTGVETSFFDPILEQVGLGPVERSHLSHTIAEVRETVDAAGPRLRQILASLQQTTTGLQETAETIRPAIEASAGRVEDLAKKFDGARVEESLTRINSLTAEIETILAENRPVMKSTLANVRDLTSTLSELSAKDGPKLGVMLERAEGTRARLDEVLNKSGVLIGQSNDLLSHNRANIDRTVSNVRDASDFGVKLVGKLYGNPFYLSPFYKPTRDDVRAQGFYDAANTFMLGAKELSDTVTELKAIQTKPLKEMTEREVQNYNKLLNEAWEIEQKLKQAASQLAGGMATEPAVRPQARPVRR